AVRIHHRARRRHRGTRARRGRDEENARPVSSPPRFYCATAQRNRSKMSSAARLVLCVSGYFQNGNERKRFGDWLVTRKKSGDCPRLSFWRKRQRFLPRMLCDELRAID